MWEAAWWGFVGGLALLVGALAGMLLRAPRRVVGLVMAFGAGVLISAVAFELVEEAFDTAGATPVVTGLAAGALVFFVGDRIVDRRGGDDRKRSNGNQAAGAAGAIVLGSMLDGVPESVAIGASLLDPAGGVGIAMVTAVFLSNIPESWAATVGLTAAGRSRRWILTLWLGVAVLAAVAAAGGHLFLGGASPGVLAFSQAFAAGAVLTMLADTMMPEAFDDSGALVGIVTTAGFTVAFLVGHLI